MERNVIIERVWKWQTERFAYRGQSYSGGVGKLSWRLLDNGDKERASHLNRLLHLAFYTGIGYKTTHGLGQMRLIESAAPDKQRRESDE